MRKLSRYFPRISMVLLAVFVLAALGVAESTETTPKADNHPEITVYNENLALVKETRLLNIPAGTGTVKFTEVPELIDPTTVSFKTGPDFIRVQEQNYEYDVVSDMKLLQKFLGEKIKIITIQGDNFEGYLLGSGDNLILASGPAGGEVKVVKAAQVKAIIFPDLPKGLVMQPTLVWLIQNTGQAGNYPAKVSYLTGGLSWQADYVAIVNQAEDRVDLTGWVTLNNQSGADFDDARLKLVAGEVHRVADNQPQPDKMTKSFMAKMAESDFKEDSFFEYHLYTLNRTTTLKNNQIKQVELLAGNSIPAQKIFIYNGGLDPKKVQAMLEFKNSVSANLGMPLPKGRIRVQKADADGSLQFIGEDRIDHTPKDEKVRVYLGNAFDIVGERVNTGIKEPAKNVREESYRITLRNHKETAVSVTVVENMNRWDEWKITTSSHDFVKTDAGKAECTVKIPANDETVITYTVRYKF
jgi:Uncharacterized conserved protein